MKLGSSPIIQQQKISSNQSPKNKTPFGWNQKALHISSRTEAELQDLAEYFFKTDETELIGVCRESNLFGEKLTISRINYSTMSDYIGRVKRNVGKMFKEMKEITARKKIAGERTPEDQKRALEIGKELKRLNTKASKAKELFDDAKPEHASPNTSVFDEKQASMLDNPFCG